MRSPKGPHQVGKTCPHRCVGAAPMLRLFGHGCFVVSQERKLRVARCALIFFFEGACKVAHRFFSWNAME